MHAHSFLDGTSVFYDECGERVGEIRNCNRELAEKVLEIVSEYFERQERESARWSNVNIHFDWSGEHLKVRVGDRVRRLKLKASREEKEQVVEFITDLCKAVMDETGAEGILIPTHDLD